MNNEIRKSLESLIKECRKEMDSFVRYKKRGSSKYVPDRLKSAYLTNMYMVNIANQLLKLVAMKEYTPEKLIYLLEHQDWLKYSTSGKAHNVYTQELADVLMEKRSTDYLTLIVKQSVYLENAASAVADWIRG